MKDRDFFLSSKLEETETMKGEKKLAETGNAPVFKKTQKDKWRCDLHERRIGCSKKRNTRKQERVTTNKNLSVEVKNKRKETAEGGKDKTIQEMIQENWKVKAVSLPLNLSNAYYSG